MNGKNKCKLLKQIRQKIADENDISYVTTECKFQGECTGTCPKCEAEVRYLEQELDKRKKAGKAVAVAGIAAAMVVTATGCDLVGNNKPLSGYVERITEPSTETVTKGSIANAEETTEEPLLIGEMPYEETLPDSMLPGYMPPSEGIWGELLEGDVPFEENQTPTGETDYTKPTEELFLTGDVAWPIP